MKLILSLMVALTLQTAGLNAAMAGTFSPDIVGGRTVAANDTIARRTVALYMLKNDGKGGLCTGSILNGGTILSAAHCVYNVKKVVVIFALNNIGKIAQAALTSENGAGGIARVASNFRQLPGYSGQAGGSDEFPDLALITFKGGLPVGYEPAHFLNQAETAKVLRSGAPVTVAGYGITSVEERNQTISGPNTSGTLRQVTIQFASFSQNKVQMFLKGPTNRNACSGDSGGPAMVTIEGNPYVIGIASRSDCIQNSIYTWVPREKAAESARYAAAAI
jgi:secreted trypsin-like serine protease